MVIESNIKSTPSTRTPSKIREEVIHKGNQVLQYCNRRYVIRL